VKILQDYGQIMAGEDDQKPAPEDVAAPAESVATVIANGADEAAIAALQEEARKKAEKAAREEARRKADEAAAAAFDCKLSQLHWLCAQSHGTHTIRLGACSPGPHGK